MQDLDIQSALITGGAGFIGSNLAIALSRRGIQVRILDSMASEYGGNKTNLAPVVDEVDLKIGDVRNETALKELVKDVDVVFHLAAQLSRPVSMEEPRRDLNVNGGGTLAVLEAVRAHNPQARVIYTSSQAVFGSPMERPLTEESPTAPVDIYGANKLAAESYCQVYNRAYGISTVMLRLTNVYGPRSQLQNSNYGVINKFLRLALQDQTLTVYEPGDMKRDPVFVDDVVAALIRAAIAPEADGETFVIGSGEPVSVHHLAERITETVGGGTVELVAWPDDWDSIKVGDVYVDPSKAAELLDWKPSKPLRAGLHETVEYFRSYRDEYLST